MAALFFYTRIWERKSVFSFGNVTFSTRKTRRGKNDAFSQPGQRSIACLTPLKRTRKLHELLHAYYYYCFIIINVITNLLFITKMKKKKKKKRRLISLALYIYIVTILIYFAPFFFFTGEFLGVMFIATYIILFFFSVF